MMGDDGLGSMSSADRSSPSLSLVLRLCLSGITPEQIARGVGLLGEAMRELSGRSAPARGQKRA